MRRNKCGFTLIELMVAVAIMVLLAGLGIPTMVHQYAKSKRLKAISQIQRLEAALENYKADMGAYPVELTENEYFGSTTTDRNKRKAIIEALSGFDKNKNKLSAYWNDTEWHGPYFEFKKSELDTYGQMIDPWRQAYLFDGTTSGRTMMNQSSFDILSRGADKEWDSSNYNSSKNDDNICNWLPNYVNDAD